MRRPPRPTAADAGATTAQTSAGAGAQAAGGASGQAAGAASAHVARGASAHVAHGASAHVARGASAQTAGGTIAHAAGARVDEVDARLETRLRDRGHRVTSQRILVYRALWAQRGHLTAEQVLESVSSSLPRISLPTIYATLELLEEIGLVRRLSAGTGALLFESRTSRHSHAICRTCGSVLDIDEPQIGSEAVSSASAVGFAIDDVQLLVWGVCEACRPAASEPATAGLVP